MAVLPAATVNPETVAVYKGYSGDTIKVCARTSRDTRLNVTVPPGRLLGPLTVTEAVHWYCVPAATQIDVSTVDNRLHALVATETHASVRTSNAATGQAGLAV